MKKSLKNNKLRYFKKEAKARDKNLGVLKLLPGVWKSEGRGWNMIALPFQGANPPGGNRYRVLMNQYNEELCFTFVDDNIPNRGIASNPAIVPPNPENFDQKLISLDYQQIINQIAADDFPKSGLKG